MTISYPSLAAQVATSAPVSNKAPTTASTELFPANPLRASGALLINNTNKVLWIRLDVVANAAGVNSPTSFSIPANGGNYLLPAQYQGAVQGLVTATATGTVQFIEPTY